MNRTVFHWHPQDAQYRPNPNTSGGIATGIEETPEQHKTFVLQQYEQAKRTLKDHLNSTIFMSGVEYDKRTKVFEKRIAELEPEALQYLSEDERRVAEARAQEEAKEAEEIATEEAQRKAEEDAWYDCPKCGDRIRRTQCMHTRDNGEQCYSDVAGCIRAGLLTRDAAYQLTGDPKYES